MKKLYILPLLLSLALLCGCGAVIPSAGSTEDATAVSFEGGSITVTGGGAKAAGSTVSISAAGSYRFSGVLDEGQIVVDTGDDAGLVTLILDSVTISNSSDAAIVINQAKDVTLYLPEGTESTVSSGSEASLKSFDAETASGAAIYAQDDLDIDGEGTLNVFGWLNNGIASKNDIDIKGGVINVTAANNGVRGSDSVEVKGGVLSVSAGNDGIKATETEKAGKGFVNISGGAVGITAAGDGISAERELSISGGTVSISAGTQGAADSGKGVKSGAKLTVSGGVLSVSSVDHALHSAAGMEISGGVLAAYSSDGKGLAAHGDITFTGGEVNIVSAKDGIGAEGSVAMSGGSVSAISGKDPVSYKGTLVSTGGALMGIGNSKRIKGFDASSTQGFFACSISGAGGTTVEVRDSASLIWTVTPQWQYNTVIFSSPGASPGKTYTVSNDTYTVEAVA